MLSFWSFTIINAVHAVFTNAKRRLHVLLITELRGSLVDEASVCSRRVLFEVVLSTRRVLFEVDLSMRRAFVRDVSLAAGGSDLESL